jgi:hypothetical protein
VVLLVFISSSGIRVSHDYFVFDNNYDLNSSNANYNAIFYVLNAVLYPISIVEIWA